MSNLDRRLRRLLKVTEAALTSEYTTQKLCKAECNHVADDLLWIIEHAKDKRWRESAQLFLRELVETKYYFEFPEGQEDEALYSAILIALDDFYAPLKVFVTYRRGVLDNYLKNNALNACENLQEALAKELGLDTPHPTEITAPLYESPLIKRSRLHVVAGTAVPSPAG
jgi:hypothetical protein